ncbi:MAG: hypothetical protein JO004_10840 [Methylobacteriaceae bacterium]|nr:hypothetical protein [Methylobacteriaceae bacterium]
MAKASLIEGTAKRLKAGSRDLIIDKSVSRKLSEASGKMLADPIPADFLALLDAADETKAIIDGLEKSAQYNDMALALKNNLDRVFEEYGIDNDAAKREVFARLYQGQDTQPEATILRAAPASLHPVQPHGRTFDADTIKTANQVMNRYNYQKRKGKADFTDEEMTAVRAAGRVLSTLRRKHADRDPS